MDLGGGLILYPLGKQAQGLALGGSEVVYRSRKRLLKLELDIFGSILLQPDQHVPCSAQDLLPSGYDVIAGSLQGDEELILISPGDLDSSDHMPEWYLEGAALADVGELDGPLIPFSLVVLVHKAQ